jgi:hypothetical protein
VRGSASSRGLQCERPFVAVCTVVGAQCAQ